jgi:hypothetical protein
MCAMSEMFEPYAKKNCFNLSNYRILSTIFSSKKLPMTGKLWQNCSQSLTYKYVCASSNWHLNHWMPSMKHSSKIWSMNWRQSMGLTRENISIVSGWRYRDVRWAKPIRIVARPWQGNCPRKVEYFCITELNKHDRWFFISNPMVKHCICSSLVFAHKFS